MKDRYFVWPGIGAGLALIVRREMEQTDWSTVALFAVIGAAIGLGLALAIRRP
jgi:hypothetical protein